MYLITVHCHHYDCGEVAYTFTGTFLRALAEAKRLSLAAHSWVTLANPDTNRTCVLRHRDAATWLQTKPNPTPEANNATR